MKSPRACVTPSNDDTRRFGGFTLVELLVAMVLLALVGLMLAGAMRFGARSYAAAGSPDDPEEAFLSAAPLIRRLLEQSYPLSAIVNNERQIQFMGDLNQVAFVGFMPEGAGVPGLAEIALVGTPEGRLVLRWRLRGSQSRPAERVLLPAATVRFRYWGSRDLVAPPVWSDGWPVAELAPLLIRVEIAGAGRVWPPIVAAPKTLIDSLVGF